MGRLADGDVGVQAEMILVHQALRVTDGNGAPVFLTIVDTLLPIATTDVRIAGFDRLLAVLLGTYLAGGGGGNFGFTEIETGRVENHDAST